MEKLDIVVPEEVLSLIKLFDKFNKKLYIVGGAVRDFLLNKKPKDYDFCTDALPNELVEILAGYKTDTYSLNLGNIKVVINDHIYAITTLRQESGMIDGRYPEKIEFVNDINIDLKRRDFTINAMALEYNDGFNLIDPLNGQYDIQFKYIRFIGDPVVRIKEDPIRILRAIKFMLRLDFNIAVTDMTAIFENIHLISTLDNNYKYKEFIEILGNDLIKMHLTIFKDLYLQAFPELSSFFDKLDIITKDNAIYIYFFSLNKEAALNQLSYLDWSKQDKKVLRKALNSFNSYEEYLENNE